MKLQGGVISCYHDSLDEAKEQARKIAEGRVCDEVTEENACSSTMESVEDSRAGLL